jgi:hypothetical protein
MEMGKRNQLSIAWHPPPWAYTEPETSHAPDLLGFDLAKAPSLKHGKLQEAFYKSQDKNSRNAETRNSR